MRNTIKNIIHENLKTFISKKTDPQNMEENTTEQILIEFRSHLSTVVEALNLKVETLKRSGNLDEVGYQDAVKNLKSFKKKLKKRLE